MYAEMLMAREHLEEAQLKYYELLYTLKDCGVLRDIEKLLGR